MTTTTHVPTLEHSIHQTNGWLGDVAAELDGTDRQYAYRTLRATLHALRDRLTVDEAAQLAAQLRARPGCLIRAGSPSGQRGSAGGVSSR
jgi:uncharacterized protein (DUF2267 family)